VGFGVWSNVILGQTLVSDYCQQRVDCWRWTNRLFVWWFAIRLFCKQVQVGAQHLITGSLAAALTVTAINLKSYNVSDKVIWVILGRIWRGCR
jgi:hypothetical protein